MLRDLGAADPAWQTAILRYFNPVGAHESGLIGEDPRGTPNNLMPYVAQVAVGRRECLQVFGNDYPTPDGTGVRDYIHVVDLAEGHVAALRHLLDRPGSLTVNLGTGRGYSVLEVVRAYAAASGRQIPYQVVPRRPGDVAACYADPSLAAELLGWRARHDLDAHVRRQLALAVDRTRTDSRPHDDPDLAPTRDDGRRLRHAAVAAVAQRLSQAVPGAVGQPSLLQQAAARLQALAGADISVRRAADRRQRGAPLPGAGPVARVPRRAVAPCCSSRWAATPHRP
jgi:hypothetical protein